MNTDLESVLAVLGTIAGRYPEKSDEHEAISLACRALLYLEHRDVGERFVAFAKASGRTLTQSQREHLASLGIDIHENATHEGEEDVPG